MKTQFFRNASVAFFVAVMILACNPVQAATSETRPLDQAFYGIVLQGNANVFITQGDAQSVRVEGLDENRRDVQTSVSNGALIINAGTLRNVNIYVSVTDISLIQVNGSGVIKGLNTINSDMLLMKITGSGMISVDVRALTVGMIINGGGKIYAGGVTGDSYIKVKGSGQVISMNLDSLRQTASVENIGLEQSNSTKRKSNRALTLHQ